MVTRARLLLRLLVGCVLAVSVAGASGEDAGAHAALDRTDPPSNEVLGRSPGRVELRFTEPVEQTYTKISLYEDQPVGQRRHRG